MKQLLRVAMASLIAMLAAACGQQVALFSNMSERDANEVLASLDRTGIVAQKTPGKDGAINLTVPQADVARAVAHLDHEGLPRERRATMGDVFRKEGLISSPLEERARYLWALSQELSETLAQIDGVLTARVHVVLPERSTGGDPGLPSSAAVFVKHQRDVDLQPSLPELKRLVASSIPGLTIEKVNVVLMSATDAARGDGLVRASPVGEATQGAGAIARMPALTQAGEASRQQRRWLMWAAVALVALLVLGVNGWLARRWLRAPAAAAARVMPSPAPVEPGGGR